DLVLCIEDPIYRQLVEFGLSESSWSWTAVSRERLAETLAAGRPGTLLLQSEECEEEFIELSRKLKRLFGDELNIVLLSSDYQTQDIAGYAIDSFLQYPVEFDLLSDTITRLKEDKRSVLVVDDSKLVHRDIVPPLKDAGYEVIEAYNGEEGLALAKERKPDLIISDIEMPVMNGFEMCNAIRNTSGIEDTYIIMSSTLGSAADQQEGFEAGVDEYITKPVVISEFLDRVKKVFKSARVGREAILLVLEDLRIARVLSKSLGQQGFSTRHVTTVKEAFETIQRSKFDLAISEIYLNDGSMIDLLRAIQGVAQERQPDTLILTSRENRADEKMVLNAGAAGVISKPFTMDSLVAAVERALADRRAVQERSQLDKYMSKASRRMAIEKSILWGKMASTRADKKYATIFFSDVANFTERCEKYPPATVVEQMNAIFEVITHTIIQNEGDIDKFIGDACLAFWVDDDPARAAELALRSTIAIQREVAMMNQQHEQLKDDPIQLRIGINSGEVILCDLGSAEARVDFSVIGDPVNVAARFEGAAKMYGVHNLIGSSTVELVSHKFAFRPIDYVRVKGK
ncbi:MAG: response regulator, partial [Bdellovibrionales bacterium]|nr:response regulator [Bdellovibrionales bacterium]